MHTHNERRKRREGFRERKREFLEREALRLCVCERVKKSLVLFGERKRERGLPRNLNIKKRERELEFFCFCFFCVWVLRVMVAVHVDRIEGVDGEDWVLWGRRGDFGFGWSGGLWLCT